MVITLRFDPKIIKLIKRGVVKKEEDGNTRIYAFPPTFLTLLLLLLLLFTFSELDIGGNQFRIETLRFTDIYIKKNDESSSVIGTTVRKNEIPNLSYRANSTKP